MDVDGTEPDPTPGLAAQAAAGAAGAGIGLVVGGPLGAAAGAAISPALEGTFQHAWNEITGARRRSAMSTLNSASARLEVDPDEVVRRALTSLQATQLLGEALSAAANTADRRKIEALARALARGLAEDDARIDEEALVVAALAAVEPPHIRVLTQLSPERSRTKLSSNNLRGRTAPRRGQPVSTIAEQAGMTEPGVRAVLAVLQRVGMAAVDDAVEVVRLERLIFELQQEVNKLTELTNKPPKGSVSSSKKPKTISRPGTPAATAWAVSSFGRVCLDYLDDIDPDEGWRETRQVEDPLADFDAHLGAGTGAGDTGEPLAP